MYHRVRSLRVANMVKNHLHTYERRRGVKRTGAYFKSYVCVDPDCSSVSSSDLILNKRVRCRCGNEFIIDDGNYYFRRAELKCPRCSTSAKAKTVQVAESIISTIFSIPKIPIAIPDEAFDTVMKLPEVVVQPQLVFESQDSLFSEDEEETEGDEPSIRD